MGILQSGREIQDLGKKLRDDMNKPSYVNTASYKARRKEHEDKRESSKQKKDMARKLMNSQKEKAMYNQEMGRHGN